MSTESCSHLGAALDWLEVHRGNAPLVVSFPHTGTELPGNLADRFVSPWLANRDVDWWVHQLYEFVRGLGATTVRTRISRSVIDVNRRPDGESLYPGQNTTGLCPTTSFDNTPLYPTGLEPGPDEICQRRTAWFDPYHQILSDEITRLRSIHHAVVLYDAHSIRSHIPFLFDGELAQFNIGTASAPGEPDKSCSPALGQAIESACASSGMSWTRNGRFRGGWITRRYGNPGDGVHAVQMELACRGSIDEPRVISPANWPPPFDPVSAKVTPTLERVIQSCLIFAGDLKLTPSNQHHPATTKSFN